MGSTACHMLPNLSGCNHKERERRDEEKTRSAYLRQRDRQTGRQTYRQADRLTDRQTDLQTGRHAVRQPNARY